MNNFLRRVHQYPVFIAYDQSAKETNSKLLPPEFFTQATIVEARNYSDSAKGFNILINY
jgi:hypothetical protein